MTEDELEKSLREILPSEGQRKKIDRGKIGRGSGGIEHDNKRGPDDDSFARFNTAMVEQYFKEEKIRQQHKVF